MIPFLTLLVAATALLAAGCGGDDDGITVDEWVSQADTICQRGDQAQQAAVDNFLEREGISRDRQPTAAQIERLANEVVITNLETQIEEVEALPRPEEEADQIDAFLDQANSDLLAVKNDPSLLVGGGNPFEETSKLADGLGLDECAA